MSKKRIALIFAQPTLQHSIEEQLALLSEFELGATDPDLVIADRATEYDVPHLVLGKAAALPAGSATISVPLRLGAVIDQVRYLLSNRTKLSGRASGPVTFGVFVLQPDESQLVHTPSGEVIRLTDKERLFLLTLFEAPGMSMDRKGLLEAVWGYAATAETHTLETHLYRLRQKLEPCGGADLIVSGDGVYRLKI